MFRGKIFERKFYYFGVLNEFYLQNFLHRLVVNRKTNLTSLINPWSADDYWSTTVANYKLSRLIRFVSWFINHSCKKFSKLALFSNSCMCLNIWCDIFCQIFLASKHGQTCERNGYDRMDQKSKRVIGRCIVENWSWNNNKQFRSAQGIAVPLPEHSHCAYIYAHACLLLIPPTKQQPKQPSHSGDGRLALLV